MTTYIYALKDPVTLEVRYIGKTNNPIKRYSQHCSNTKKDHSYKANWIRSLPTKPIMSILAETTGDWVALERFYIDYCRQYNYRLVNCLDGGQDSPMHNPAVAIKVSRARLGMKFTEEHKLNISISHKGLKPSAIALERRSTSLGKKYKVTDPNGNINIIISLRKYAIQNGVAYTSLRHVINKDITHKGYFVRSMEK